MQFALPHAPAVALLALALLVTPALAQNTPAWPAKPVKFVNTFPPGGPSDILARSVADVLQNQFKQTFVVENKPGAGGGVGADAVLKGGADGYTVLIGIDTTFTVNPHIYKASPFKPSDFKPVMIMASSGLLVGANPTRGFKTLADMVTAGKQKPLTFSSGSNGSPGHLAAEIFTESTGAKVTHVPYRGNSPAVTAVLAGEVDGGVLATPGMLPHVQAGKITALAVTSRQRSPLAPEVPTVAEAGLKALELEVLYVAMVPIGTPEPVTQAIQRAFAEALLRPEIQERLHKLDLHHEGIVGAAAAKRLSDLSERYARIVKATGMKVE